jgi:hypothetical protein
VPFSKVTDEAFLHPGDDIDVGGNEGAQLREMGLQQRQGGILFAGVNRVPGIGELEDRLQTEGAHVVQIRLDFIEVDLGDRSIRADVDGRSGAILGGSLAEKREVINGPDERDALRT